MIAKYDYLLAFNFLLKKFIQQHKKAGKMQNYTLPIDDYNFLSFYNILQNDFEIETMVIRLDDWEDIEELSFPAIAFLKINGGIFVLMTDYKDGKVYWESKEYGKQTNTINLFKKISTGILLVSC
nr:cysteine peptidase family C39 domain-containing protein [uncultured Chryseobacterium sp.]